MGSVLSMYLIEKAKRREKFFNFFMEGHVKACEETSILLVGIVLAAERIGYFAPLYF